MASVALARGSSPHTRGARRRPVADLPRGRIIPAYAGSTSVSCGLSGRGRDHPRIRGEHESSTSRSRPSPGSSPHTRGARFLSIVFATSRRIIPAYAGSTRLSGSDGGRGGDHPRIRGEHSFRDKRGGAYDGSSPHTRGARRDPSRIPWVSRIIPAYAGSTLIPCSRATSSSDHPRIRGEHCPCDRTAGADRGSSPHTRGARGRPGRAARSGMDHPRIRGEHARAARRARL